MVGIGFLRNLRLEAMRTFLHDHEHENNQEHQENVDERSDVHLGRGRTTACH